MSEVSLGTVYDINKNLMQHEKKLSSPALANKIKHVKKFFEEGKEYFMLLCHDLRDYTVFRLSNKESAEKAAQELKECLLVRGEVLAIDKESNGGMEIWIKNNEGAFCYYLFPYDNAIIEV